MRYYKFSEFWALSMGIEIIEKRTKEKISFFLHGKKK
jgi:hypothetical protein